MMFDKSLLAEAVDQQQLYQHQLYQHQTDRSCITSDGSASGTSGSDTGAPAPAPGPDVSGTSADLISITINRYNNDKTDDTSTNDLYW